MLESRGRDRRHSLVLSVNEGTGSPAHSDILHKKACRVSGCKKYAGAAAGGNGELTPCCQAAHSFCSRPLRFSGTMLSLYSATSAYAGPAPLIMRAAPSAITMKSPSLPWKESPAHLEGMVGNVGFDPWGLSTPQNIKWMREAELKHGRMCQLAWAGASALFRLCPRLPAEQRTISGGPLPLRCRRCCHSAAERCCRCRRGRLLLQTLLQLLPLQPTHNAPC